MAHPSFDPTDIAHGAAAEQTQPVPAPQSNYPAMAEKAKRNQLGWLLVGALIVALTAAVALALQQTSDAAPRCGGLYSDCCDDNWNDDWGTCPQPQPIPDPERCGGLHSECCDDNWNDDWGTCPQPQPIPDPERCRGLYSDCCHDNWNDDWGTCPDERDFRDKSRDDDREGGLFD